MGFGFGRRWLFKLLIRENIRGLTMDNILEFWSDGVRRYIREKTGAIAILFAILIPVLLGIAGMSLDYSQAYLVKQRLAQALDAAALAAVASSTDEAEITQRVKEFFEVNYPEEKLGFTFEPYVYIDGEEVVVYGYAQYNTMFLGVLGIDTIDVAASTTVLREVQGIEVVLVMDNTGSMASYNNISTLRTAASNFVYIMYGIGTEEGAAADPSMLDSMATREKEYIKIGLVPYAATVNVGPYGLGKNLDGSYYDEPFVNNPFDLDYTTSSYDYDWKGCVLAQDYPLDTEDNEGPWDMYRYCLDENDEAYCNLTYNYYTHTYSPPVRRKPNYGCPNAMITPLSTSPSDLKDAIDDMTASGNTHGNFGMVWGYRVLSQGFPFREGVEWDNQYWRKAIVMMTDGVNTVHSYYSAYGPTQDNDITTYKLNERFADVCENIKSDGALVYTVTFTSGVSESTKDYYRECATSEDYYYDAPSQDDLIAVFEKISRELSNLHITD
jgi:Flp pilus assembly protein TadG